MCSQSLQPKLKYDQEISYGKEQCEGGSIIDQCIVTAGESGTFFLEQHLLYVVLGGRVKLTCGRQSWTVGKNQMILLRKAHCVSYEKKGSPLPM